LRNIAGPFSSNHSLATHAFKYACRFHQQRSTAMIECEHIDAAQDFTPKQRVCEECVKMGDRWVHLRICLSC
jgi:hypothetical protein